MSLPRIIGLLALIVVFLPAYAAEKTTYFHFDALGSPVAATDQAGNVVWREEYRPYGDRIRNEPAAQANTRWYTGHPHDDATGLTYMGARYYDPVVGRFMAIDPKNFSEDNIHSFNRYAYANNNPYKFVDPDGNVAIIPAIVWVGKAIGEGITDVGLDAAIAQWQGQEFSLGDAVKSFGTGTGAALVGAGAVVKARKVARLAELTKGANKGSTKAPDFVVSPNGTVFPVPKGAQGPVPVINPAGKQTGTAFTGGKGGANGQVDRIRIMDPTPPRDRSPGYPRGYIKYENKSGQGVDPYTGRTLPNSRSHFPIE